MASDRFDLELTTMQNIADALAGLDAPARSRVLLWLRLRFESDDAGPAEATVAADEEATAFPAMRILSMPTPIADYDDTLSVDNLDHLFDHRRDVTPPAEPPPLLVTSRLSDLVAEFQHLARDWDNACDALDEEVQGPHALPAAS